MAPFWAELLRAQQAAGFPDFAGAHGSVVLPISDRFVSRLAAERQPPNWPVSIDDIRAEPGNQFTVSVRVKRPAFLPVMRVRAIIDEQPHLPQSPTLGLRLDVPVLAAPFLRLVKNLPPGLTLNGNRITVDLFALLATYGAADLPRHIDALSVTTADGKFVVSVDARI